MYYCVFCRQLERVRIHMHRYPPVYVCIFTYYKYTYSPLSQPRLTDIHTHTRAVLPKNGQRNILDFTRSTGERSEKSRRGLQQTRRITHFPNLRRREPHSSVRRSEGHSLRGAYYTSPTRIDFYTYTQTHRRISMRRRHVKPCMYRTRAYKTRNYNASRSERPLPFVWAPAFRACLLFSSQRMEM